MEIEKVVFVFGKKRKSMILKLFCIICIVIVIAKDPFLAITDKSFSTQIEDKPKPEPNTFISESNPSGATFQPHGTRDGYEFEDSFFVNVDYVTSIVSGTSDDHIWYGTTSGLVRHDTFQNVRKVFTTASGLPSNRITSLARDNNEIWIGTDNGVSLHNLFANSFTNYNMSSGL
jgi:hypothetical protein